MMASLLPSRELREIYRRSDRAARLPTASDTYDYVQQLIYDQDAPRAFGDQQQVEEISLRALMTTR